MDGGVGRAGDSAFASIREQFCHNVFREVFSLVLKMIVPASARYTKDMGNFMSDLILYSD